MAVCLMSDDDRITITDAQLGVPDGDKDTTYTLRPLTRAVYKQIIKKNTSKKASRRGIEEVTDWVTVSEELLDYALVGWAGILWKGEPAPCELTMKLQLDPTRASAILEHAGLSQVKEVAEERGASFRGAADVR